MAAYLKWLLIASLLLLPISEALTCWECDGTSDQDCNDPFDKSKLDESTDTCIGDSCLKAYMNVAGIDIVQRSCLAVSDSIEGCMDVPIDGQSASGCVCTSNLCNAAHKMQVSVMGVLSAIVLLCLLY